MKAEQALITAVDNQLIELKNKLAKREAMLKEFADPFNWVGDQWWPQSVELRAYLPEQLAAEALK